MRRKLFKLAAAISLVLCIVTCGLWVRSYWRLDTLFKFSSDAQSAQAFGMQSAFGELSLFAEHSPADPYGLEQGWNFRTGSSSANDTIAHFEKDFPQSRSAHFLGFGFAHLSPPRYPRYRSDFYVTPHWFCALIFAALPALRLRSILRKRRQNRVGLCPHCGYDLRATPERCPECGTAAVGTNAEVRVQKAE